MRDIGRYDVNNTGHFWPATGVYCMNEAYRKRLVVAIYELKMALNAYPDSPEAPGWQDELHCCMAEYAALLGGDAEGVRCLKYFGVSRWN
jgi:hypothetical protein